MERYLVKKKKETVATTKSDSKDADDIGRAGKNKNPAPSVSTSNRYAPYSKKERSQMSDTQLTKHLLETLKKSDNPICWSDAGVRSDYVSTLASGHQRGGEVVPNCARVNNDDRGLGLSSRNYWKDRSKKLQIQDEENARHGLRAQRQLLPSTSSASTMFPEEGVEKEGTSKSSDLYLSDGSSLPPPAYLNLKVMSGVRIYINGLLRGTTDLQVKRLVVGAGGKVLRSAQGATHIITSQEIVGPKAEKLINSKLSSSLQVVSPEWISDSIAKGRKLPVKDYLIVFRGGAGNKRIADMFKSTSTT